VCAAGKDDDTHSRRYVSADHCCVLLMCECEKKRRCVYTHSRRYVSADHRHVLFMCVREKDRMCVFVLFVRMTECRHPVLFVRMTESVLFVRMTECCQREDDSPEATAVFYLSVCERERVCV